MPRGTRGSSALCSGEKPRANGRKSEASADHPIDLLFLLAARTKPTAAAAADALIHPDLATTMANRARLRDCRRSLAVIAPASSLGLPTLAKVEEKEEEEEEEEEEGGG